VGPVQAARPAGSAATSLHVVRRVDRASPGSCTRSCDD